MISTSTDATLKVWDCLNQTILIDYIIDNQIEQEQNRLGQIQLINNKQDILCNNSYSKEILIFAINYQSKYLRKIYNFKFQHHLKSFQQVNNDENLLLIFHNYWMIFNKQRQLINKTYHNIKLDSFYLTTTYRHQLDNLNYIILWDGNQLHLQRVKDKN